MKPADVKPSTYIEFNSENKKKYAKFEVGYHLIILRGRNIFAKDYVPNWSEKVFAIKES